MRVVLSQNLSSVRIFFREQHAQPAGIAQSSRADAATREERNERERVKVCLHLFQTPADEFYRRRWENLHFTRGVES